MQFEQDGWIFAQTPIWAACDPHISDGAHRLLAYLDWRQGHDDYCWPSLATMAKDLGIHPDTIRRRLRVLEEAGYLITHYRNARSSAYTLVPDPDGASGKYTPRPREDPRPRVGPRGRRAYGRQTPAKLQGGDRKSAGPGPAELQGGDRKSAGHDDRTGQEKRDKEKGDEPLLALWGSVLENLRLQTSRGVFETWLIAATARWDGETLVVQLASQQAMAWVSQRLHSIICRTVRRVFEREELCVVYEVR